MQKKSFTYEEAIKAILCYLGVIIMIESNYVWVRGPSTWGIDNRQGDFNFTRHYTDAAPFKLKFSNCRKNKRSRITGNKKLVCGNKKDPTCYDFSRYSDNGSITEDQTIYDRNKIKYIQIIL